MRKILFPIRDAFLTALLGLGFSEGQAQNGCNGERYRYTSAFPEIEVSYDHVYGGNINALGLQQDLVFDLYTPADDIAVDRALVVVAHGGFFLAGSNDGADVVSICEDLAHMGYVVASISYRLGVDDLFGLQTSMIEAVWRGVHDARAAVRFFRKSVVEADNPYGIDPERILMGGVSAGGFIALHHAYVNQEDEIPDQIDQTAPGMGGGLEGESGNLGYDSDVMGIFNIAGALHTVDWMASGDVPLVSVHGDADQTVPYGTDMLTLTFIPIIEVDGSATIHSAAENLGIENCLVTLPGLDHVAHVGNAMAYQQTFSAIAGAMSGWLCADWEMTCETYDYTSSILEFSSLLDWHLYPNPLRRGELLKWEGVTGVNRIQLMDATGRTLFNRPTHGMQSIVLDVPPGVYWMMALDSQGRALGRSAQIMIQ